MVVFCFGLLEAMTELEFYTEGGRTLMLISWKLMECITTERHQNLLKHPHICEIVIYDFNQVAILVAVGREVVIIPFLLERLWLSD